MFRWKQEWRQTHTHKKVTLTFLSIPASVSRGVSGSRVLWRRTVASKGSAERVGLAEVQNDERFNPVCYSFLIVSGFVAGGRLTSPCSRNNLCGHKKNPQKTLSFRCFESCGLLVKRSGSRRRSGPWGGCSCCCFSCSDFRLFRYTLPCGLPPLFPLNPGMRFFFFFFFPIHSQELPARRERRPNKTPKKSKAAVKLIGVPESPFERGPAPVTPFPPPLLRLLHKRARALQRSSQNGPSSAGEPLHPNGSQLWPQTALNDVVQEGVFAASREDGAVKWAPCWFKGRGNFKTREQAVTFFFSCFVLFVAN